MKSIDHKNKNNRGGFYKNELSTFKKKLWIKENKFRRRKSENICFDQKGNGKNCYSLFSKIRNFELFVYKAKLSRKIWPGGQPMSISAWEWKIRETAN